MTAIRTTATCTGVSRDHPGGCGWATEGPGADTAADKHTRTTGHATTVRTTPITTPPITTPITTRDATR